MTMKGISIGMMMRRMRLKPVQPSSFAASIGSLRQALQADQEEHHVEAGLLPGVGADHREGVEGRLEQPARGSASNPSR